MNYRVIFPILAFCFLLPWEAVSQDIDVLPTYGDLADFPPPPELQRPMVVKGQQLRGGGPPGAYPRAREALCLPLMSHNDVYTDHIMNEIKAGLQHILQTKNEWTFPIQGSGLTGGQAIMDNLIEPGDKVLVLENGYFGPVMGKIAHRLGAHVFHHNTTRGLAFSLEEITPLVEKIKPKIVTVVHGETSATVYQSLEGWGDLCRKHGALLVVDAMGLIGFQPFLMDKMKMDAIFAGIQKGFGAVVGMSVVSLSPRAVEVIKNRKQPPYGFQTDLTLQHTVWTTKNPDRFRYVSLSLPLMYSLREGVASVVEEGLENVYKRHRAVTEHFYKGMQTLGLKHLIEDPKMRLIGTMSAQTPKGKDTVKIVNYINSKYRIEISGGFGPFRGEHLRFGLIGAGATIESADNVLAALKDALESSETNA